MVAMVTRRPKKKGTLDDKHKYVYTYDEAKKILLNHDLIPAISIINAKGTIDNTDSVIFPDNLEELSKLKRIEPKEEERKEIPLIDFGKRAQKIVEQAQNQQPEQESIIIQKLRELVIRFERLLAKYLDPDLPTGRRNRRKFMEERKLFAEENYKQIINAINLKVDALCKFEHTFEKKMFDGEEKDYLQLKIDKALEGDFLAAQEVVNSVMQIVIEDEFAVPIRKYVTKLA